MQRRNWYLLTNSLIGLWLIGAAVAASTRNAGPQHVWLMVHLALLGALSTAIFIWSQHFADTLLRRPGHGGRRSLGVRLGAHTAGAGSVVIGMLSDRWMLVLLGGVVVAVAAASHALALWLQMRGSLPARFRPLVRYYIVAALMLVAGVAFGILLARSPIESEHDRLLLGHVALNFLGWVGLTVTGTIILLWPTSLHARIRDGATRGIRLALPVMACGILLIVCAAALDLPVIVSFGIGVWLIGIGFPVAHGIRQARETPPKTFASWSLAAGMCWLLLSVAAYLVVALGSPHWGPMVYALMGFLVPFVLGGALQVLLGALSYLLPVVTSGSPRGGKVAAAILNRGTVARLVLFNGGLLCFMLPLAPSANILASGAVLVALLMWFALTIWSVCAARKRTPPEHSVVSTATR